MIDKCIMDNIDGLDNHYVLDIIKNYKTYGYDKEVKEYAEKVLKSRHVPDDELLDFKEAELERESELSRVTGEVKDSFRVFILAGLLANTALAGLIAAAILKLGWLLYADAIALALLMIVTGIYDSRIIERTSRIKLLQPVSKDGPEEGAAESAFTVVPSFVFMLALPVYFTIRAVKLAKYVKGLTPKNGGNR
ncbi:MAG: hypothetical protein A2Y33_14325 [Spirochaetes bacterium GWF1_51_8]|nr:MAG: hypothetical protein A2Y33_14325 [Spirochaetes bacterium GWF1_51_8]